MKRNGDAAGTGRYVNNEEWLRKGKEDEARLFAMRDALTILIQFNVPIEVITPAQGRVLDSDCERYHGHPSRFHRRSNESHSSFLRGSPAFLIVARKTGRNDILPGSLTALHLWNDMVEREVFCRIFYSAVLAGVFVALINISPRETDFSLCMFDSDEFEKPEDGGEFERDGHTPDIPVVEVDYLDLALGEQRDCPLP